jgi:hypothetical protein
MAHTYLQHNLLKKKKNYLGKNISHMLQRRFPHAYNSPSNAEYWLQLKLSCSIPGIYFVDFFFTADPWII